MPHEINVFVVKGVMAVVLLLSSDCFVYLILFRGIMCWSLFVMHYCVFCNHLEEEERAGCFALIV